MLGVAWDNLTVTGVGGDAMFNENVLSQLFPFHRRGKGSKTRTIIGSSFGCVKPGEMLLVLGRLGAGCTTLLNVIANHRLGYEEVTGQVSYGNMSAVEARQYRGQIVMNTEEKIFFPTLSVDDTINFAARMKVPYQLPPGITTHEEYVQLYEDFLLRSVAISHTARTKVGDAFIRGVCGGERRRVSILECLTTRASVFCWDNSTRGLDASTALEWIKAIRVMTDLLGLSTIVTLYQAGNGIYEHFDKVLLLDDGKQIFYGPQKNAVPFMEGLGFMRDSGSNRGDFLTGVTVPTERVISPGYEDKFPRTADEIRAAYEQSHIKPRMLEEAHNYATTKEAADNTTVFKEMVAREKHRGVSKRSSVTTGFVTQVTAAITRQYQLMWGDKGTLLMKQGATVIRALLGGSLFYSAPDNFIGFSLKGGALFSSILYNALIVLSEVTDSFTGRPILAKHRSFALYHPAAICIAQVAADLPILLFQVTHFGLVLYFMVGLKNTAGAFFTYLVTNFMTAMSVTAFFRLVGAAFPTFDAASKVSGLSIVALFVYMGYMIIKPEMHPWFVWIFWINPMAYGFEALLGNEFYGQWALFVVLTIIFTSRWRLLGEGDRKILIPRELQHGPKHLLQARDEEAQSTEKRVSPSSDASGESFGDNLLRKKRIFTWKCLTYTVQTADGDRILLDNVQGYVKPGMLGALMGSSGAGKTTLLDVLAQRKTSGSIHGSVLDIHEPYATVRKALEVSARLRQPRGTPTEEKLRYVDTIVDLLELNDLQHTLIGRPGAGLSVEQRKRHTIGVELVAKPSILIFLDEPTSGLDGQAAYNTVRFLRKLAEAGQAILVTIHQPSAQLFAQFDKLLLLAAGSKTVYFGDIGQNANTVKEYFGHHGAPCPPEANPAEHIIDVVSASASVDWTRVWLESPEHEELSNELDCMVADAGGRPTTANDDPHEFTASLWTQTKLVTHRMNVSLFRNTEYLNNKFAMHISLALLNGFTFWQIGDALADLQQNLFTVFNFILLLQMYHWAPFVTGLIVSEFPYLLVCALLYYVCWYFTSGLPTSASHAGSVFFAAIMYECLYTGIGQMIAAYTPNAVFASLVNPLVITTLVSFCGVMVPYSQIVSFWRYWMYYLDPFNYLMSSLLVFTTWDKPVHCQPEELAVFDPAPNLTCGEYLDVYQRGAGIATNLLNPDDTFGCQVCQYTEGGDYLRTLNLQEQYYGWRNAGIVVVFVVGIYGLVFLMMKLRTKATKKAES
ncbi:hypothetical protein ATEG_07960 [Aspergillus terreus NIH2624]|uniref:ABC transporter domain-containing protein n=1 Tax=Aspergillus terreus (strain NIH 2624 / FGSC A1156) TaxID=341663 RepID=Q0CEC4_ASPTN|nr:uncharacterized protein ATEG_07960 [Aspergillus terreus NIH2624]EAU32222.1 hypothetical protein ATEG_07960 [Aspergillus terreus NIH2624]